MVLILFFLVHVTYTVHEEKTKRRQRSFVMNSVVECFFPCVRTMENRLQRITTQLREAEREVERLRAQVHDLQQQLLLQGEETDLERMYECKICMQSPIECVFLPCGHTMACRSCAAKTAVCPVCATELSQTTFLHVL